MRCDVCLHGCCPRLIERNGLNLCDECHGVWNLLNDILYMGGDEVPRNVFDRHAYVTAATVQLIHPTWKDQPVVAA